MNKTIKSIPILLVLLLAACDNSSEVESSDTDRNETVERSVDETSDGQASLNSGDERTTEPEGAAVTEDASLEPLQVDLAAQLSFDTDREGFSTCVAGNLLDGMDEGQLEEVDTTSENIKDVVFDHYENLETESRAATAACYTEQDFIDNVNKQFPGKGECVVGKVGEQKMRAEYIEAQTEQVNTALESC